MKEPILRVAVILEEGAPYSLRLMEGALRYTESHRHIQLQELDFICDLPPKWLNRPLECDGILLWASPNEKWVDQLLHSDIPMVSTSGSWPPDLIPMVGFNSNSLIQTAHDYLVGLGRPTLAMALYNMADDPGFLQRQNNFTMLAAQQGRPPAIFDAGRQRSLEHNPPRLTAHGQERLKKFLLRLPLPAALWAMDDFLGYAIVETAKEIGINVPEQLAVLGLGDYPVARYCQPPLSTIPQPGELIGFEGMRVLHGLMSGQAPAQRRIAIAPPPIVVRDSTRPTASAADESMNHVHDFMVQRACQGLTAEDILKLVPISLPTLNKRFLAVYGTTPGSEIRRIKTEQAQHYLKTTTLSIAHVGRLCGYDHPAKFANFFKRESGMSPSQSRAAKTRQGEQPGTEQPGTVSSSMWEGQSPAATGTCQVPEMH